ncbi:MAG TPA: DUF3108 domain-containing protein, partial [Longimicrobiales bacterium]|nr:DUF3108 domain-containing protein [Longimicrobiales bacterium]
MGTLALGGVTTGTGAAAEQLPFFPGEELTYRMRAGALGTVAMGKMTVERSSLRGTPTLLLTSEFNSSVGRVGGRDRTRSWVEQGDLRVLRYEKSERTPFSRREDGVDVFPAERRWITDNGKSGR